MDRFRGYLINMDGSEARLAASTGFLSGEGIAFERVSATDGRRLTENDLAPFYNPERTRRAYGRAMAGGEIGCYLSHLDCLRRFVASGADFGLVMEDDVTAIPGAGAALRAVVAAMGQRDAARPAVVNMANRARKLYRDLAPLEVPDLPDLLLRKAYYFPLSSAALLWNRAAAEGFLADCAQLVLPYDVAARAFCIRRNCGYGLSQAVLPPAQGPSEIDRVARRPPQKTMGLEGFRAQQARTGQRIRAALNKSADFLTRS